MMAPALETISTDHLLKSYRIMVTAREIDLLEQSYTGRGEAFFHVSGAGHEGTVLLAEHLGPQDWLYCHSRGRQMNAHMSAPELNVLSLVGPVGNSALTQAYAPIVLCGLGEGMTQENEVLEAIEHTVRNQLPVLFVVQDNAFTISTQTKGRTFYDTPHGRAEQFYGIPIAYLDGRKPQLCYDRFAEVCATMRQDRRPAVIVFDVGRLSNHTNADDQRVYRSSQEIARVNESGDPLVHFGSYLIERGLNADLLPAVSEDLRTTLARHAEECLHSQEPTPCLGATAPLSPHLSPGATEYRGDMGAIDTKGLSQRFPGRVRNSPLSESLILGESIGKALASRKPVAFLQFADFPPIAYNQIVSELGSMYRRTDESWQAPVTVMITCGGSKPGLGPFHASSFEALAAHTPGVDVFMPSTAGYAAGLLNAAFRSGRPTLFFYPKTCLNDRDNATSPDLARHLVPIGRARTVGSGNNISFVAYGNTVALCRRAAEALEQVGVTRKILDLRSLVPWDEQAVIDSVRLAGAERKDRARSRQATREEPGTPLMSGVAAATVKVTAVAAKPPSRDPAGAQIGMVDVMGARGSRVVSNQEVSRICPEWSTEDIVKRTGIKTRPWVAEGETAVSLASTAARRLFDRNGLQFSDIDLILCTTGTPAQITPSTAYDLSAACSGYLYGLQVAYDYLSNRPDQQRLQVKRPVLASQGESGSTLCVPSAGHGACISMEGPAVFVEAVKDMITMLERACAESGITPNELDLIVPHQANQRIINAVRQRVRAPKEKMYSNIAYSGNTSSSSIPLCLEEILAYPPPSGSRVGLAAFGGGFTFAGRILEVM